MLLRSVFGHVRCLSFIGVLAAASCVGSGDSDEPGGQGGEGGVAENGEGGEGAEGGEGGETGGAGGEVQGSAGGKGGSSSASGGKGGASQAAGGRGGSSAGGASAGGTGGSAVAVTPLEYYKAECASCHGDKGEGTQDGPEIQHPVRAYAKEVIRKGRMGHPDYTDPMDAYSVTALPDASLNAIFDFLDAPPKPTTGKALYVDYCQNCHGAKGNDGLAAHAVSTHIADIPKLVRSGHGGTSYLSRTSYMPAWTPQQLTDAELKLIADAVPEL